MSLPDQSAAGNGGREPESRICYLIRRVERGADATALDVAAAYVGRGLSVIPVRADGSKAPALPAGQVEQYRTRRPTPAELHQMFAGRAVGIGILGGPASDDLAVLDFETWAAFARWGGMLTDDDRDHLRPCPVVRTPGGGAHVYCLLDEPVKGTVYAKTAAGKVLIETRGFGQYVVAPGSPAACHPTGRPYRLARPGWLGDELLWVVPSAVEPPDLLRGRAERVHPPGRPGGGR